MKKYNKVIKNNDSSVLDISGMISLRERSLTLSSKRKCKKIISRQHYSCVTELTERKLINEKYKMILKRQEKLLKVLRKFGFYSKSNRKPLTSLKQKE